jgi:hypothetical protein
MRQQRATLRKIYSYAKSLPRDVVWRVLERFDSDQVSTGAYEVTDEQKRHWEEHGWVILRSSVSPAALDELLDEIQDFRKRGRGGKDEHGRGLRVGLLHAVKRQSLKVALNEQVRSFMSWAFGGEPVLFGSLTFDIGSEQEPHIDAAFFYTRPEHCMAAAWTALEDISPDSGPLFYVDKSHKFERLYAEDALKLEPELAERVRKFRESGAAPDLTLSDEVYKAYSRLVRARIDENKAELVPAVLNRGDVFIWHGWLIHGGLPRNDRKLTRKSMVAHFIRADAAFWDQDAFFLRGDVLDETPPVKFSYRYLRSKFGRYIKYDDAVTFDGGDGHFES